MNKQTPRGLTPAPLDRYKLFPTGEAMKDYKKPFAYAVFLLISFLVFGAGCSKKKEPPMPPRPVETAAATQKDVPRYIQTRL